MKQLVLSFSFLLIINGSVCVHFCHRKVHVLLCILVSVERSIRQPWQDARLSTMSCKTTHGHLTLLPTAEYIMLYFENITIPKTAVLLSAFVQFTAKDIYSSYPLILDVKLVLDAWNATEEGK